MTTALLGFFDLSRCLFGVLISERLPLLGMSSWPSVSRVFLLA